MGVQFGTWIGDSIAYVMILSLGIVHGANDLLILKKGERNKTRFLKTILGYLALIGLCILSFFIHSYISLLLFIIISGYHFGEQHFEEKLMAPNWWKSFLYMIYGSLIFLMIFIENMTEVDAIVYSLTESTFSEEFIWIGIIVCSSMLIFLILFGVYKKYTLRMHFLKEIFYLALLHLTFKATSLILGFAIYFIFWHSIPSIIDQTKYISGVATKRNVLHYFKAAVPFWGLSIVGLVGLYFWMDESLFSSAIFLILFAVTAPHAWVMYRMKKVS
jgi:Brp/Blh family beta-carotene 15,15'-monooxygenase